MILDGCTLKDLLFCGTQQLVILRQLGQSFSCSLRAKQSEVILRPLQEFMCFTISWRSSSLLSYLVFIFVRFRDSLLCDLRPPLKGVEFLECRFSHKNSTDGLKNSLLLALNSRAGIEIAIWPHCLFLQKHLRSWFRQRDFVPRKR